MNRQKNVESTAHAAPVHPLRQLLVMLLSGLMATQSFAQEVASFPLSVTGNVPGNVALAASVEFPTAISVANQGNFVAGREYLGYFDPEKCYRYRLPTNPLLLHDRYNTGDDISYFYPVAANAGVGNYRCTAASLTDTWSGSFLNWMTMQAVDPFRWALTGGYRRVDNSTTTILERAWSPNGGGAGQGSDTNFPPVPTNTGTALERRQSPSAADIADYTPMSFTALKVSVRQRGNEILISNGGTGAPTLTNTSPAPIATSAAPFLPHTTATHQSSTTPPTPAFANGTIYRYYARVQVCVAGMLEDNCVPYSGSAKPEGLLQSYAKRMRFSALGYLNDPTDNRRDAGVLRARQKFVGPENIVPGEAPTTNTATEWNAVTGILATNPDSGDASDTATHWGVSVPNSGVINYINKFGQQYHTYKRRDPVGELYYAALRYMKNQGNVAAWMPGVGEADKARYVDGFPVVQTWDDPVQYSCQRNFILGIGDTNSSWDRNLPGSTSDFVTPPAKPALVSGDTTVDATAKTNKVGALQGLGASLGTAGGDASSLIAGLAYHAATQDIRPDLDNNPRTQPRGQNIQTYWLDVLEFGTYLPNNQYYLATKYGGLKIPDGETFDPDTVVAADIEDSWWSTTDDLVGTQRRPDNYYTVADPQSMVSGLRRAFARIAAEGAGSASSLAANSTRLETDTMTFQAEFTAGSWSGDLNAFEVDEIDGSLAATAAWSASDLLNATTTGWSSRNILVNAGGSLEAFEYGNLTPGQQSAMGATTTIATNVVNFLRGERANEQAQGGALRTRTSILGDIVNSTPVYVGSPNSRLYAAATFTGAASYAGFATGAAAGRTPIVYVGANDGMLHAFNADDGSEVFAFVPGTSISNGLAGFSDPNYEHEYSVDGEIAVADIYDGGWKTVLVGSMGRGGPGVFALDVTDPDAPTLMWELNSTDIPQLGKNIGRPVIAQVANGDWRVLIGNGPGATGGRAHMVKIQLSGGGSGTVTIATPSEASTVNGLTAVLARDSDADGLADTGYAGDLRGNLWKFTGLASSTTTARMFTAEDAGSNLQPITAAPLVGRDPATGQVWVFFGTGQYLGETDLSNDAVNTWYGLKDTGATISGRGALVERDIVSESVLAGTDVRVIEEGTSTDLDSSSGWFIDLISPVSGEEGERMVVQNRFQGNALIGTTRIPEEGDPCSPGGKGFIMAIDPFSGARLSSTFFDVNGDGLFNEDDMVCDSNGCLPVSGVGFESSPNNPIFIENVMQVSLDDGSTRTIRTQGSSVQATRLSWRELFQ